MEGYPRDLSHGAVLKNGTRVWIRAVRPDDEAALSSLFDRLSGATVYQRFFAPFRRLPPDWYRSFVNVDYTRRLALVAERDGADGTRLIGVARYEPTEKPDTVEVALVVEDAWQGGGLGTELMDNLLRAGEARGFTHFRGYILADNHRMLSLVHRVAAVERSEIQEGVVELSFARRPAA
jgi:acetyltransferase